MDYIPEESAINVENIEVSAASCFLLPRLGSANTCWCISWIVHCQVSVHGLYFDSSVMLQVDSDTYDLLRSLNMANLPGVKQAQVSIPALTLPGASWRIITCIPSATKCLLQGKAAFLRGT